MTLEPLHYGTAALLALLSSLVIVYRFYWGTFKNHVRRFTGHETVMEKVECIEKNTDSLKQDHAETMDKIETLQHGQVTIAETVAQEHDLEGVEDLRRAHFGKRDPVESFFDGDD